MLISCAEPVPTVTYNLADETPPDAVVGNIADSLLPSFGRNVSFVLMISKHFQYLSDFFRLTSYGDLITLRQIDRDNTNEVCGPLVCCKQTACEINATVFFHDIDDSSETQPVPIIAEEKHNGLAAPQGTVQLIIRINDANDNAPHFLPPDFPATTKNNNPNWEQPFLIYLLEGESMGLEPLPMAVDADSQANGVVEYRLIEFGGAVQTERKPSVSVITKCPLNRQVPLNCSGQNGVDTLVPFLTRLRPLDYEDEYDRQISGILLAVDGGSPPLTGSLSIVIHLLDVNDHSPVFNYSTEDLRTFRPSAQETFENITVAMPAYGFRL
ncbi:putative cadherin [Fasciolopsis buskii]|uniref:Putative cadherin n=1 Tax=Fasciolopsis buskii TaxID=27845 RepID=A0A8E0VNC9_9TREM|nr:putative cadherin [Fasciolopsis buski]